MVVVTNADGRAGVAVAAKAGATLPHLDRLGVAVLATGVILLGLGALAIGLGVPRQPLTAGRPSGTLLGARPIGGPGCRRRARHPPARSTC